MTKVVHYGIIYFEGVGKLRLYVPDIGLVQHGEDLEELKNFAKEFLKNRWMHFCGIEPIYSLGDVEAMAGKWTCHSITKLEVEIEN